MEKTLENKEGTETQVSKAEFMEQWGAVEVDGQIEKPQDVTGERKK